MLLYHARWVIPVTRPPIEHATVAVREGKIAYVGERAGAPPGEDQDLGDALLLPGLVNAHTHLELTAMRGFLEDLDFQSWIRKLTRARREALADLDLLRDCARLGIAEGIQAGVTTFADTCDSGVSLEAMRDMGVRGIMFQELFGPAPERAEASLAELSEKVGRLRPLETSRVRLGVSPHAPYSVSDPLFAAVAAYARAESLPLAVHIAESAAETELVRDAGGPFAGLLRGRGISVAPRARSPVALLAAAGVLDARPLLIHCVRVDAEDLRIIAEARCGVAHCPASNAKLGHGLAPLAAMLNAGIDVGLGSDSVASSNRMDVLEEARLAALLQGASDWKPRTIPGAAALELATIGGARALGLAELVGSLEVGKEADVTAFRLDTLRGTPTYDPVVAAIFALAGVGADFVAVSGEVLLRGGALTRADAPALAARARTAAAALASWERKEAGRH